MSVVAVTLVAAQHLSPSCSRSPGPSSESSPTKPRVAKAEGEEKAGSSGGKESDVASQSSQGDVVKVSLEEANRMLKSLSGTSSQASSTSGPAPEEERKDVMERLQQQ